MPKALPLLLVAGVLTVAALQPSFAKSCATRARDAPAAKHGGFALSLSVGSLLRIQIGGA